MSQDRLKVLDSINAERILETLPRLPLLTNRHKNWISVRVRQHPQPARKISRTYQIQYAIAINQFNRIALPSESWIDARNKNETIPLCKPLYEDYSGGLPSYKLKQAIEYIQNHLSEDLSLAEIAHAIGMSQYYFARLFKQSTGVSPYQYVIQCRVERARQLLVQGQHTIADIALEVGFANQSHLTQNFKRIVGITPRQFLKSQQITQLTARF